MEDNIYETEISTEVENEELDTNEKGSKKGLIGLGAIALGAGIAAIIYRKNKARIHEWKLDRLRKKGYVIYSPEDVIDDDEESEED